MAPFEAATWSDEYLSDSDPHFAGDSEERRKKKIQTTKPTVAKDATLEKQREL